MFREAWKINWKNKFLWWFGFFVTLGSFGSFNYSADSRDPLRKKIWGERAVGFFENHPHYLAFLLAAVFVVVVIFLILSVIGRAGLLKSGYKVLKGETSNYKEGYLFGKKYFWRVFGINFLTGLFIFLAILVLATPVAFLILAKSYVFGVILGIFAVFLAVPIVVTLSFAKTFGLFYGVLGDLKVFSSLEKGYALFLKNVWPSIILSLLFIPLGIGVFFLLILVAIPLVIIFLVLGAAFYFIFSTPGAVAVAVLGGIILLVAIFWVRSIWEVFSQLVWLDFFQKIATSKVKEEVFEEAVEKEEEIVPEIEPVKTAEVESDKN